MFELVDSAPQCAMIKVIGVGGGGGNAGHDTITVVDLYQVSIPIFST